MAEIQSKDNKLQ